MYVLLIQFESNQIKKSRLRRRKSVKHHQERLTIRMQKLKFEKLKSLVLLTTTFSSESKLTLTMSSNHIFLNIQSLHTSSSPALITSL